MASLRARLFNWVLKKTFKSKLRHKVSAQALRAGTDRLAPQSPPPGVSVERVEGPVKGEWHRVGADGRRIFYCHGGGYKFGSPRSHAACTYALAKLSEADVFSLDYRMAPEHPFPAPVEDAVAAWRWFLEQGGDPARTVLGGDSAGGGLALALMLSIKDLGLAMPAGALLFSPWTDMAATGASLARNEHSDVMFMKSYIEDGAKTYLDGADPRNPLASPLYGDLAGLPPALIFASEDEVLLDDSTRLHQRLLAAGTPSTIVLEKGLAHVWPIFPGRFPEAMAALRRSAEFVKAHTGGAA